MVEYTSLLKDHELFKEKYEEAFCWLFVRDGIFWNWSLSHLKASLRRILA